MFRSFSLNIRQTLRFYDRPQIMGIINVTPDSFYEGSRTMARQTIAARISKMIADGADFIDMGAYSSRPGASEVSTQEEIDRLKLGMEVLRDIDREIPVSVDTFRAKVARVAIEELGADMINDISGGDLDGDMFDAVAGLHVPYILMHMRGTPATMQTLVEYKDVTADVVADLSKKLRELRLRGVSDVIVDPGFGFSKTLEQNYELMRNLDVFDSLDCPVLVGVSRKSMVTKLLDVPASDALAGTIALNVVALGKGAAFLRVQDVKEAVQALNIFNMCTKK